MTMTTRVLSALSFVTILALPAAAQDLPMPITVAANCAPRAAGAGPLSSDLPQIVGAQDTSARAMYAPRDLVIVNAGTGKGVQTGQKFFIRRKIVSGYEYRAGVHAATTAGWLTITAADENTSIGRIEFACDGILQWDYLEAWAEPALPPGVERADASGELDFSSPARVLFGDYGRLTGGLGDMMLADIGQNQGAVPGARYAIYRDLKVPGVPLAAVGEAIVVSVGDTTSLLRLTRTKDAITAGDLLIPRK
jgi:hypothetical protein